MNFDPTVLNNKVEPLTFGSCLSISLENHPDCYLSSQGFINTILQIKKLDSTNPNNNFNFSVFRILPFSNYGNFVNQNELNRLLQNFAEESNSLSKKELKERKEKIRHLRANLDLEINTNITIYNKLKGTPVLFGTSVFQLVHLATMKYLSLNEDNKDNLYFELVDFPSSKSFFNLQPCLKLQKQRNNYVYNGDLVTINSTRTILNRNPSLFTTFEFNNATADELHQASDYVGKVTANIEEVKNWRIHLYQNELEDHMENNFLQVGDAIWLNLAETNHVLTTSMQVDPFEHQHMFDNSSNQGIVSTFRSLNNKRHNDSANPGDTDRLGEEEPESSFMQPTATILTINEIESDNYTNKFFESEVLSRLILQFKELQTNKGKEETHTEMNSGGLWKLESSNVYAGGSLEWDQPYRLKNISTQRYLKVQLKGNKNYSVELSNVMDSDLLFNLVPIKNLIKDERERRFVAKDAYFRLQHVNTKQWISLREDLITNNNSNLQMKKEDKRSKIPTLSEKPREVDTFKVVKADFEEIWEMSFLLSSIPCFIELIEYMKPLNDKNLTKEEIQSMKRLNKIAEKAIYAMNCLDAFCFNKLPGNIATNQEFIKVSPIRQEILREQHILGLLCWLLTRGFPNQKEVDRLNKFNEQAQQTLGLTPLEALSRKLSSSPLDEFASRNAKQEAIKVNFIQRKYNVCMRICQLLKTLCMQNAANQAYVFKFINFYVPHVGNGNFISDLVVEIIRNNEKIMYGLHEVPMSTKMLNMTMASHAHLKAVQPMRLQSHTFFSEVVSKFQDFATYEKKELLDLLNTSCLYQDQAIYINQDKVFKLIYEDIAFRSTQLIDLDVRDDELIITLEKQEYQFSSFFSLEHLNKYRKEIDFLKSQLDLYATLCSNRNYSSAGTFSNLFKLEIIIKYIMNDDIPEDIRAIFVKLITTIHIDKEPRTVQEKPNLVRVVDVDLQEVQKKVNRAKSLFHYGSTSSPSSPDDVTKGKNKNKIYIDNTPTPAKLSLLERELSPHEKSITPTIKEEDITEELLEKLRNFVLSYLEEKSELCKIEKLTTGEKLYNRLTYEVIQMTGKMLKFGLFNIKLIKQNHKTNFLAGTAHSIVRMVQMDSEKQAHTKTFSGLEKLIQHLAPLLEFDEEYFKAMHKLGVQRKHEQKSDGDNVFSSVLTGATGLGKSLFAITDIFSIIGGEDIRKRVKKTGTLDENDIEIIKDQIFKKSESLKKVLEKFSSKTFTVKEEEGQDNYEVSIKISICETFDYIFDMREDFVIENIVHFFKDIFIEKAYTDVSKDIDKFEYKSYLKMLLPDSYLEVGASFDDSQTKMKNFTKFKEIKSFDAILERPFIESLLLGFFFTNSAPLQNSILNLLERSCNEKGSLKDSVEKLELLFSEDHKNLYNKIAKKLNVLKNLTSNAQIWLQIIERSLYQPTYFNTMEACYKKLTELYNLFQRDMHDSETTKIKQRIFRYLGGHKTLFEIIQKGISVYEGYIESFREPDTSELTLKYRIDIADKIVLLFRACHSVLSCFCHNNFRYQHLIFQSFNKIMLLNKLNMGQIGLINEIFKDNYDLARNLAESKLKMLCDLIIQHGQKEIFLEVFDHLITHPNQDTLDIQKKVLLNLFDDHYADRLNPFNPKLGRENKYRNCFAPDKNPLSYTYKFLEVLSKCLKGNVGVTLISRVYKFIKIKDLVELLYKSTQREKEILEEITEPSRTNPTKYIQTAKIAIIEILLVFFSAFPQSIDELSNCTKTLIDDFTFEAKQLQSKDIKPDHLAFVLEKLLPLVILYSENFLKESRFVDKNEIGRDFYQNETINKRCILNITNIILKNLEDFSLKIDLNETHITNIARIAQTMKVQFPQILKEFINNMEQNQTNADEVIGAADSSPVKMSKSQKASQAKKSFRTSGRGLGSSGGTGVESGYQSEYSIQEELKMSKSRKKISVSEIISKSNNPSDQLTSLWRNFKEKIIDNNYFKKSIKKDLNVLSNSLLNFSTAFVESDDKELREFFISGEDLFIKLMNYLQFWIQKKANKASIIFLIKALSRIIKNSMDDEDAMIERQNMFDRLNTTKILMVLIWEDKNHDTQYLYSIFKFMIRILLGGNPVVQKTIADLFMSSSISEKFFRKVNDLILREIAQIDFSSKYNVSKEISHLGKQLLRLLQLFCEGHNLTLQNYLRQQTNSKTNYDIVTLITKLLCAYKVNSKNFESVMQCFDTLTELTQGPCQANQIAIINSKFLEFAVSLLNEEDKAIDYVSTGLDSQTGKSFRTSRTSGVMKDLQSMRTSQNIGSSGLSLSHTGSLIPPKTSSASGFRRKRMRITLEQLTKVKHKCLITLVSLLEGNNSTLNLSTRIMRAIPISVLTDNLIQVYKQFKRLYKNKGYTEACFNHHQEDYKPDKKQAAEFIIENGFNIYILINLFLDNQAYKNIEDEDLNDYIDGEEKNLVSTVFDEGIIGELRKFWSSLFSNVLGAVEMVKKNVIDKALKNGDMDEEEAKLLKEEIEKKQLAQEAISFFRSNMGHIEIVRNGNLEKIYFPILPYCKYLSKDLKAEFQDTVNRTSTKTKVADLIQRSDELIKNMKHEEKMAHFLNHYKVFGLITNHVKLWESFAFLIGMILNLIILASYANNLPGGKNEPYLFFNEHNHDMQTITTLGVLNLVFTSLVVTHFFLKRAPVLVADIWEGFLDQPFRLIKTPLTFIKKVIYSFIRGLQDFDILQNCCIILFAILGLAVHPFFFFFMLTYFVRIDLLKNVLKAVWEPRVPLVLTILVFFLAEYYFSLIGYLAFYTNYNDGQTCQSLWECYLTTIDQTFKQTGAVGAYLQDPDMLIDGPGDSQVINPNKINWARFFFDNAFKIIIVLIIVNMIAGIIIDKFGALKESMQEKEEDMTQKCFICGIEREKLDKSSDNKQGFDSHIKKDHYMWNYVFYKAYLKFKEPTEYDGNESYIAEKIQSFDSSWFPINRAMAIQDEESELNAKIERVSKIAKQVMDIKTSLRSNISRMNHLAETMDKYKNHH